MRACCSWKKNRPPEEQENEENAASIQQLSTKDLSSALSHFEEGIKILREKDPVEERSLKVSRDVNEAIDCYKQLYREKKNSATQLKLHSFFKPVASTSFNTNPDVIESLNICSDSDSSLGSSN